MKEHRLSTQLLTGKERMRAGREKLKLQVLVSQDRKFRCLKVWDVILSFKNKFGLTKCIWPPATNVETPGKVKAVGSKLREDGPRGARRAAWCLLASLLFYQGWSGCINTWIFYKELEFDCWDSSFIDGWLILQIIWKTPPSGSSTPSFISCWDLRPRFSFCFPLCSDSRRSFRLVTFWPGKDRFVWFSTNYSVT